MKDSATFIINLPINILHQTCISWYLFFSIYSTVPEYDFYYTCLGDLFFKWVPLLRWMCDTDVKDLLGGSIICYN